MAMSRRIAFNAKHARIIFIFEMTDSSMYLSSRIHSSKKNF
jgi:hypothetical protein